MSRPTADSPGVIALPPLLFLVTAALGTALHFAFPVPLPGGFPWRSLGAGLALVSGVMALSARAQMVKAGTNINPNRPTTAIVREGPFGFTRNPMYLSLCLLNLGIGFLLRDWVPVGLTLGLALVLHHGVIVREERYLERKFGETYTAYRRRVRRWL